MAGRAKRIATDAQESRRKKRAKTFRKAKGIHEGLANRSGASAIGTDENGQGVETRNLNSFKVIVDRWHIGMSFKHEDLEQVEGKPWKDVEQLLKDHNIPRDPRRIETHIIPAVRAMKHLRRGYEQELERTDALLARLDMLNASLAVGTCHAIETLDQAIKIIDEVGQEMSRKRVAVKRIVASKRLGNAADKLSQAILLENERDFHVGAACAILVSVRNRLGGWRDSQVAKIAEHNLLKEAAMRAERDRWLYAQFARLAVASDTAYGFWMQDPKKIQVLDMISQMLRFNVPKQDVLDFITESSGSFKVSGRTRRDAERHVERCQAGIQPKIGAGIDYMVGHYAWLFRHVRDGRVEKAEEKVKYLRVFVEANKPDYIYRELSKDPDSYVIRILDPLAVAVDAFALNKIGRAERAFAECRDVMREYAYRGW